MAPDLGIGGHHFPERAEARCGRDAAGATPLHWAASNARTEAATALMRGGAEIDKRCGAYTIQMKRETVAGPRSQLGAHVFMNW